MFDLLIREVELKKRLQYPYKWGMKQNNRMDELTDYIYETFHFDAFLKTTEDIFGKLPDKDQYFNYAINRWFAFWSAMAVERVFCSSKKVVPAVNKKDRLVDFQINGISFDHKTTVFPAKAGLSFSEAEKNPEKLIAWLYLNQSSGRRQHYGNRLFVVLYDPNGEHWKLKAEIALLKRKVDEYTWLFDKERLIRMRMGGSEILSDIIWVKNS